MYQNGLFQLKCMKGQGEVIFAFGFISTECIPALSLFIPIKKKKKGFSNLSGMA